MVAVSSRAEPLADDLAHALRAAEPGDRARATSLPRSPGQRLGLEQRAPRAR